MKRTLALGWREEIDSWGSDREALFFEGQSHSFLEIANEMGVVAARLDELGVESGDLVALLAPPSKEGFVLIHTLLDRGVVMVPMNLRWTSRELQTALESVGIRWLVVTASAEQSVEAMAESLDAGILRLEPFSPRGVELDIVRSPLESNSSPWATRREEMVRRDGAVVLFTSGTSGPAKAALLSGGNLRSSAAASIELLGSDASDRWLCCMPLFHIGGLSILIRSVLAGTSVALHRRFDAEAVDHALDADEITRVSLVAAMLSQILDVRNERRAPENLSLVLLGGGPASREILEIAHSLGYPVAPTYGLTEAASQVATRPPDPAVDFDFDVDLACGLEALPGTEIRIVSAEGNRVAVGDVGEIEVRGPSVMQGYLDDLDATARVLHDGWLRTGDLGRLDANGGLQVLDRRSDLIVSGGENVYPAEVEGILVMHPDIAEAGVVGLADDAFGERPIAFLVALPGRSLDFAEVLDFCKKHLARYKIPKRIVVVDELPRTVSGKLLRRDLKQTAELVN